MSILYQWLDNPHVKAFWDNSAAHRADLKCFAEGRITASHYFDGRYDYWLACLDKQPYGLIMSILEHHKEAHPALKQRYLSHKGHAYSLDYMIGEVTQVGKGLGATTLHHFTRFFSTEIDPKTDTFFIDPDTTNKRACHVYEKAGFVFVGTFAMSEGSVFEGQETALYVMKV